MDQGWIEVLFLHDQAVQSRDSDSTNMPSLTIPYFLPFSSIITSASHPAWGHFMNINHLWQNTEIEAYLYHQQTKTDRMFQSNSSFWYLVCFPMDILRSFPSPSPPSPLPSSQNGSDPSHLPCGGRVTHSPPAQSTYKHTNDECDCEDKYKHIETQTIMSKKSPTHLQTSKVDDCRDKYKQI